MQASLLLVLILLTLLFVVLLVRHVGALPLLLLHLHLLLLFLHLLGTGDGRVLSVRHVIARQLVPALICHILATLLDIETRIFNAGLLCLCAIRLYIDLEEDKAQGTAVICGS